MTYDDENKADANGLPLPDGLAVLVPPEMVVGKSANSGSGDMILTLEQQELMPKECARLLRAWEVELQWGPQGADETFAVKVTSRQLKCRSRIFLERELYEQAAMVIREMRDIGAMKQSDFGILLKYVEYLKDSGLVTEVPSLALTNGSISETDAKSFFELLATEILKHQEFFPRLSSHLYAEGDNFGVQLDTPKYRSRYRLVDEDVQVFGVSSDFVLQVLGLYHVNQSRFRQVIRAWIAYGLLLTEDTDIEHHTGLLKIGGKSVRLYLFRIDHFQARIHDLNSVEGFDDEH